MKFLLAAVVVLVLGQAGCKADTKTNRHSKMELRTTFHDNYVVVEQPKSKTYISFMLKPSDPKKLTSKILNEISEHFYFDGVDGINFDSFKEQYVASVNEGEQCPEARGGPLQLDGGFLVSVMQQEGKAVYVMLTHPGLGSKPFLQLAIKPNEAPCVKEFDMKKIEKLVAALLGVYDKFLTDMEKKGFEKPDIPENAVSSDEGRDTVAKTQAAGVKVHNAEQNAQV
jgi:hypothetical protein